MINKYRTFSAIGISLAAILLASCSPSAPVATPATPQEIQQQIQTSEAPLTLVHVWATWCDPCRDEFPELVKIMQNFQSLEVVLISADAPDKTEEVETFLTEYQSPVGSLITTELNQKFIETLSPKWGGALPATFFFRDGKIVSEWEGKRTYDEYVETIETLMNNQGDPK
ncbi:TlpA disulfide reductase family protein [Pontiellaceae bacterium B1224]|nr:TlpA disulfide reductase family protein [Pontiellaceae bacterium B1224]